MADYPAKLQFLFQPFRYKVAYGGRGGGKSQGFASALIQQGAGRKLRILCTREVQRSIKDSVHKLLSDKIQELGYGAFYEVLETIIRGKNGTEFIFSGLSSQTAESIKSYEGVDRVWIEEAHTVSKRSWSILTPTIRKENSEIWISFNPVLETDDTYTRFVLNPPPGSHVAFINYYDNPWFPDVLEAERLHCKATESADDYNNIWEGLCRAAVSGAIYAQEVAAAQIEGRICRLPYDPGLKVHTVWDLGFADYMAIIMAQRSRSEVRVIDYLQVNRMTTDKCVAEIIKRGYNWGYDFLPHDGFAKERKIGMSDQEILAKFGRRVKRVAKTSEEERIKATRGVFPRLVFDKDKCSELLECLKRYRRPDTNDGKDASPIHNEHSHGADAAGYMCQSIFEMTNEDENSVQPVTAGWVPFSSSMGY